jgi:anti-sigma factor RsiW
VTCPYMESDGAYVLGALSPTERFEFERHLAGCPDCAAAVRQLAPLPGLLGRVDPAMLENSQPGASRLPTLLGAVIRDRRRQARARRWRLGLATAAAAAVAVAGTLAGVATLSGPAPGTEPAPAPVAANMDRVAGFAPITARVHLTETAGGTEVWMACSYPALDYEQPPLTFRLVAIAPDGTPEQVGSWHAGPGDRVELTGMTRLSGPDLARLELQDAEGTVLLSYEP